MTNFDPTKPLKTRGGRKARILATDLKDDTYPVAAAVTAEDGSESVMYYCADGTLSGDPRAPAAADLVNLPGPPAALNFDNGVGVQISPGPTRILIGRVRQQDWAVVNESDVPALIHWLQAYLASRQ